MNKKELIKKVKANEGLKVEEIIEYQKIVKPIKHVYGKYGNLALEYLTIYITWTSKLIGYI